MVTHASIQDPFVVFNIGKSEGKTETANGMYMFYRRGRKRTFMEIDRSLTLLR